jgi:hypothetical protein
MANSASAGLSSTSKSSKLFIDCIQNNDSVVNIGFLRKIVKPAQDIAFVFFSQEMSCLFGAG